MPERPETWRYGFMARASALVAAGALAVTGFSHESYETSQPEAPAAVASSPFELNNIYLISEAEVPPSEAQPEVIDLSKLSKAELMTMAGIGEQDQRYADFVFTREAGSANWHLNPAVSGGRRGKCLGIGQNCPDKRGEYWLVKACPNWGTDIICQLKRFNEYAEGRYRGWQSAYSFKRRRGWW